MIQRKLKKVILSRLKNFPAVALLGPRQAGKTTLARTFSKIYYDLEVEHTVKNLTVLLEPFLLICIFGVVALLALAIYLPIWNLSAVVSGR